MNNHRVQKFTSNGTFLTKWGTNGTGNGDFGLSLGIDVDNSNNIYVVDQDNSNVQKFISNGIFITKLASKEFYTLEDIAIDSKNNVYLSDRYKHEILKFNEMD